MAAHGAERATLVHAILDGMHAFGIEIEGIHTETGPGVYEAAIRYDDALRAADKAALFKTAVKEICARHGCSRDFMAKWNAEAARARSGHVHQSLWIAQGERERCSTTPSAEHGISQDDAPLHRRAGRADAGAHRALLAHHQQLQALRARASGRRSPRPGASRTAPARSA